MNDKLILAFDKSQEDVPTLLVAREGYPYLSTDLNIINVFTGNKAVELYELLTNKENRE